MDPSAIHLHHIVERTDLKTTNDPLNLAIICASCHAKAHSGSIKILGVFPSTKPPNGRTLIYIKNGVCNIPGFENNFEPYYVPKNQSMRWHGKT